MSSTQTSRFEPRETDQTRIRRVHPTPRPTLANPAGNGAKLPMNFDIQTWIPEAEMPSDLPPPIAVGENLWEVPEGRIRHRVWYVPPAPTVWNNLEQSCSCWRFEKWRRCAHIRQVQEFLAGSQPFKLSPKPITEDHQKEINRLEQMASSRADAAFRATHGSDSSRK